MTHDLSQSKPAWPPPHLLPLIPSADARGNDRLQAWGECDGRLHLGQLSETPLRCCGAVKVGLTASADFTSRCLNSPRPDSPDIISVLFRLSSSYYPVTSPSQSSLPTKALPPLNFFPWTKDKSVSQHHKSKSTTFKTESSNSCWTCEQSLLWKEKRHVESDGLLQSHSSSRISLLPCALQVKSPLLKSVFICYTFKTFL